jgi:predicted metal-dependent phosphotriesterase family hydrolase
MTDVMTVAGPVDAATLGLTLMHEHLLSSFFPELRRDGVLDDDELALSEITGFADLGGRTIVECSTAELHPQPRRLRSLADRSGLNIIMGVGHYRDPYLDRSWFDRHDHVEIGEDMVHQIREGQDGVRPGIIGEIGCDRGYLSAAEDRSFRAAAYAHLATGLTITTHAVVWPVGLKQLDVLESAGVDPRRVIIGHCDTVASPGYRLAVAARGAFVQFDTIRNEGRLLDDRIKGVIELVDAGFVDSVLLSQDICAVSQLAAHGGAGYGFILTTVVPRLRDAGMSDAEIAQVLVQNPRRALTGEA